MFQKKEMLETVGSVVTQLRKNKGLSQEQLSKNLGLSKITLQRVEKGSGAPITVDSLLDLAKSVDLPCGELIFKIEKELEKKHEASACSNNLEILMKKLSPSRKIWFSEVVLKILSEEGV